MHLAEPNNFQNTAMDNQQQLEKLTRDVGFAEEQLSMLKRRYKENKRALKKHKYVVSKLAEASKSTLFFMFIYLYIMYVCNIYLYVFINIIIHI